VVTADLWQDRPNAPAAHADVCGYGDVPEDTAHVVAFGRGRQSFELIVVHDRDGIRGYVNECPHTPLPLNLGSRIYTEANRLHCDHHYATFNFSDGRCAAGVCLGQGLTPIPLAIVDGRITIADLSTLLSHQPSGGHP
jgi:nitrite reductase/ring-hydroxylating ferredoxin subunit